MPEWFLEPVLKPGCGRKLHLKTRVLLSQQRGLGLLQKVVPRPSDGQRVPFVVGATIQRNRVLGRLLGGCVLAMLAMSYPSPASANEAPSAKRPNVVAIVTDDQGRWACGAYGNSEIHTPNIDRIGQDGLTFTNAFVATPVCSPSRATYLTGRFPTELGITDYIAPIESDAGLGLKAVTWPQVLRKNGYRTGLVGKWHLGTQPKFHPHRLGFDHFMGFLGGGTRPMDPVLESEGENVPLKGPLPDLLVDNAIQFVRTNRNQPFALCLHFRAPHLPYGPVPKVDSTPYENLDPDVPIPPGANAAQVKRWNRDYYASITSVDRNVGRLLDVLDELELTENTLVVFTSDHGYNNGRHGIDTKGNGRWIAGGVIGPKRPNMWDTSIRVPLLARWPSTIEAGRTTDRAVSNVDVFRTVLGALSIPLPEKNTVHGEDYSPLFRGDQMSPRDQVFGQYDLHNRGLAYMRMIRTSRYKYVRHFKANFLDELYDLESDPLEKHNLMRRSRGRNDEINAIADALLGRLTTWQQSINDPILKSTY